MAANTWNPELYEGRFSFVWNFGEGVIDLLSPQPGETILDLGCGTGHLSHQVAERGARVTGLDGSPPMVAQARINYPKVRFMLADATRFELPERVNAVFSNAVLHWVRPPEAAIERVWSALAPAGRFVGEFGGKDNTAEMLRAVSAEAGRPVQPWYFPSPAEYATLLERQGFRVTHMLHFDRDTELEGERGMEDWLTMFGDPLFAWAGAERRTDVIARVVERLRPSLYRNGRWWMDYKRLRFRAVKESA